MKRKELVELLDTYYIGDGYGRMVSLSRIRSIILDTERSDMLDFIAGLSNTKHADIFLGTGMRGDLWMATVRQKAKLEGV